MNPKIMKKLVILIIAIGVILMIATPFILSDPDVSPWVKAWLIFNMS